MYSPDGDQDRIISGGWELAPEAMRLACADFFEDADRDQKGHT